jgi:hypothetical protein
VTGVEALKMRLDLRIHDVPGPPTAVAPIPLFPAGSYLISTRGALHTAAEIFAGADDERFPIATATPADLARGLTLDLPVMVRALAVRAASLAGVSAIEVRPVAPRWSGRSGQPASIFTSAVAHHVATYGQTRVFFLDNRTAPEADGFWIWGEREGDLLFDSSAPELHLIVRNGAVQNDVTIRSSGGEQHLTLQPGEERSITVAAPHPGSPELVHVGTSAGFRPADADPRSQDRRYLGVYVVMPDHALR